jgi:hypothetical protein
LLEKLFKLVSNNLEHVRLLKILIKFVENVIKDSTQSKEKKDMRERQYDTPTDEDLLSIYRIPSDSKYVNTELDLMNYFDIFDIMYDHLDTILIDFNNKVEDKLNSNSSNSTSTSTVNSGMKRLGHRKTHELDYTKSLFELMTNIFANPLLIQKENIPQGMDKMITKIVDSEMLSQIVNYYFEFEWNNSFQTSFERLISILTHKAVPEVHLVRIFNSLNLVKQIIDHAFAEGLTYKTGGYMFPGYFASMCEISHILVNTENQSLMEILKKGKVELNLNIDDSWIYLYKIFLLPVRNQFKKGLLFATNLNGMTNY